MSPTSAGFLARRLGELPIEDQRRVCHLNAAELFRHPLPALTLPVDVAATKTPPVDDDPGGAR